MAPAARPPALVQAIVGEDSYLAEAALERVLQAAVPVCAGINLEYYFSRVDPTGWGCGTKLPGRELWSFRLLDCSA
jgi:hypothetical protein